MFDWLDAVNSIEDSIFQAGRESGTLHASTRKALPNDNSSDNGEEDDEDDEGADKETQESARLGFLKGYAFGLEISFMRAVVAGSIQEKDTGGKDKGTDKDTDKGPSTNDRLLKRLVEFLARIDRVPTTNDPTVNFEQEILDLRSLYKQCGGQATKVGSFLAYAKAGMGSAVAGGSAGASASARIAEASSGDGANGGASAPVDQSLDW